MKFVVVTLIACVALSNCKKDEGQKGKKGGPGGAESSIVNYSKIVLVSSELNSNPAFRFTESLPSPGECASEQGGGLRRDIYYSTGFCLTPLKFEGFTGRMDVSTTSVGNSPAGGDPDTLANSKGARVFGMNELSEKKGTIFPGVEFDLSDVESAGFVGNNTLWVQYPYKATYEYVTMELQYERIKFHLNGKFVTMMIAAQSQPFKESDELAGCNFTEDQLGQERFADADLLEGMEFKRGDYLFCVKDNASDTCAATDFKWFDTTSNSLVSTRPATPKVYQFPTGAVTCEKDNSNPERDTAFNLRNFSGLAESAIMSSENRFKLYADFSHGEYSQQWKDATAPFGEQSQEVENGDEEGKVDGEDNSKANDPFLLYYYEKNGTTTEGANLKIKFDFDPSGMLFFEGIPAADVATTSLETLLKNVYTVGGWVMKKKTEGNVQGAGPEQYFGMTVVPTVEVTGERKRPEITSIE